MKKTKILRLLFRVYVLYSITADIVVLGGILYLILKIGG